MSYIDTFGGFRFHFKGGNAWATNNRYRVPANDEIVWQGKFDTAEDAVKEFITFLTEAIVDAHLFLRETP